jgi:hypothetical protein
MSSCRRSLCNGPLNLVLTVVTTNARDFIELLDTEVHPGLIVIREAGLTRTEQWDRLEPIVRHVLTTGDPNFMINRMIESRGIGHFDVRDIPPR